MNKPIIGLTPSHDLEKDQCFLNPLYIRALQQAGAVCFMFPLGVAFEDLCQLAALCDGILFTGGPDVHPFRFGEETLPKCGEVSAPRDQLELDLLSIALSDGKPILGICRGIQLINIGLGGTIYQDLEMQLPKDTPVLCHRQPYPPALPSHYVTVTPGSLLASISESDRLEVNSLHHQAVRALAPGLTASAYSSDGLVEAVEMPGYPFLLGVQWHPEFLFSTQKAAGEIFRAFVNACSRQK